MIGGKEVHFCRGVLLVEASIFYRPRSKSGSVSSIHPLKNNFFKECKMKITGCLIWRNYKSSVGSLDLDKHSKRSRFRKHSISSEACISQGVSSFTDQQNHDQHSWKQVIHLWPATTKGTWASIITSWETRCWDVKRYYLALEWHSMVGISEHDQ